MRTVREKSWLRNSVKGRIMLIASHLRALATMEEFLTVEERDIIVTAKKNLENLTQEGTWKSYRAFRDEGRSYYANK